MRLLDRLRHVLFATREKPRKEEMLRVHPLPVSAASRDLSLVKDGTLYAVSHFLNEVCLGAGWHFEGDDAESNAEVLDAIVNREGFAEMLRANLNAMFTRFAVTEVVWGTGSVWLPARYRVVPHASCRLNINDGGDVESVEVVTTAGIQQLPLVRAVVHRHRPSLDHPEGQSVLDSIGEDVGYKRRSDDALVKNVERFSAPFIIGRYPPGMSASQKQELLDQLKKLQSASVAVLPEGVGVEIIEAKGVSSKFAMDAVSFFERRIARQVLGSILAMFEAEFGTRAQATTHWQVIRYVVASYQADIEATINEQLVQRVLAWNGLPDRVVFKLNEPDLLDKTNIARWVADLASAGVLDMEQDRDLIRRIFGLEE
jgi:phage gp29-like protein